MKKNKIKLLAFTSILLIFPFLVGCSKSNSETPQVTPETQISEPKQAAEQTPSTQKPNNPNQAPDKEVTGNLPEIPKTEITPNTQQPNVKNIPPSTPSQSYYIDIVRAGAFYDYPYVTIGDAFDYYFGQSNWYEFYDSYNNHIIEVEGIGYEYGEYVVINLQFILYPNGEFETWGLWVDGKLRSDSDLRSFIEAVFNP